MEKMQQLPHVYLGPLGAEECVALQLLSFTVTCNVAEHLVIVRIDSAIGDSG